MPKALAALVMPVLAAALVVGLLKFTHHTSVPPMALPQLSATGSAHPGESPAPQNPAACFGEHPKRFAGIAVQKAPQSRVLSYEKQFKIHPQIVEFYTKFSKPFASGEARQALNIGAIPLIQLNPKDVSVKQIGDGGWDKSLRTYASAVKKFGCTIILSFGHEMNGWWYPWSEPTISPAEFIKAWRHIHDIFHSEGVINVIWSWDPSHQYQEVAPGKVATPASEWYPGSKYVDWIGLDGYLGSDTNGHLQNFSEIFDFQLHDIRQFAPHKLIYLAETGVAPGAAAPGQIAELYSQAAANHLAGVVWFDAVAKHDYRLGAHSKVDAAYQPALAGFLK